ncbi:substrate-binding periplasmic protein [Haliovirga abyssi]|uniref:Solute-binding protein family 3/N-terminal domain-containing protein n=1 Tax=Haliovirga abyssi TaxID=2996794 RepID=A0AAU9DGS9_9FUSO|nr:transporter substrate-binding domain-containing protein [Haliovirga abyssi]BDU50662.1 hypothetical protein HLVA_12310 [Haliovirga abyssi]
MKLKIILIICFLISFEISLSEGVLVVTENFPPYNYEENGGVKGISTEILKEILKKADINYKIKVYPWARAYNMAETQKNILIYSILHTKKRENKFKWGGELIKTQSSLIKLKSRKDIVVKKLEDAKKYQIGVRLEDAGHQYLKSKKFKKFEYTNKGGLNILKLYYSRIDLMLYDVSSFKYWVLKKYGKKYNFSINDFEIAYTIDDLSVGLEFAFSKKTDDKIVEKCKKAFKEIKENGIYEKILKKYKIKK